MDHSHYARFLSHLPIFANLSGEEIADIARIFKPIKLEPGKVLCREGDLGDAMIVITSGQVKVEKSTVQGDEQLIATLTAPTVVGEMAILDGSARSATVTSIDSGDGYQIDRGEFDLLRNNGNVAAYKVIRNLGRMLCERLRDTNGLITAFFGDPNASLDLMQQRQKELWKKRLEERGEA